MSNGRIIGDIDVNPMEPKPGETVSIRVHPPTGQTWNDTATPFIRINGLTGAFQFLQFARGGRHYIQVIAEKNGNVERRLVEINVKSLVVETLGRTIQPNLSREDKKMVKEAMANLPILQVGKFVDEPYRIAFAVGGFRVFPNGLANRKLFPKKTLEPNIFARQSDSTTLTVPTSPPMTSRAFRESSLTMRPIMTVGARLRMVPSEAKLLKSRGQTIHGAILIKDAVPATIQQPPPTTRHPVKPVYHWDFGDGITETTLSSRIDHDYQKALDPNREHQQFVVTLRIQRPDGSIKQVSRTLSIYNAYAICKKRGTLVPRIEQHTFADTEGFGFRGKLLVYNVESFPITLTGQRLRVMSVDTDQPDTILPLVLISPVTVPAKSSKEMSVFVTFDQVPKNSMGFTVYYFGNAPEGKTIRVEAFFDVRARDRASGAITYGGISIGHLPMMKTLLGTVLEGRGTRVSDYVPTVSSPATTDLRTVRTIAGLSTVGRLTSEEINSRVLGNGRTYLDRLERLPRSESPGTFYSYIVAPQPVEGAECDPDNLPDLTEAQLDEGWVCQATPETREVVTPARFLNALKGDIILSPGGNGLIAGLLHQVSPAQMWSHSGIMTRNYDQVTHSTASEERLFDHPNGSILGTPAPSDGFQPNALKYLWPGVVTQSVEQATYGEEMTDPEGGNTYKIKGFSPIFEAADIDGHWEIVPALVVKPDPLLETPEIRAKLRQIANDAASQTGNSHYRFFCYTDPTIGQRAEGIAPATAGWAAGTYPSVCSSFLWMTLKRQGIHLESANATVSPTDLEALDIAAGAQVNQATPDGLYLYTAAERLRAAQWLVGEVGRLVARKLEEKIGSDIVTETIDFFTDMSNDVADQVLNNLASDWADTAAKDSKNWTNTQDANAVSPDNILFWDSPAVIGLYGFAAPLIFRPARLEEIIINRWRKVPTKGRLNGRVWYNGTLVASALVQVYDGKTDYTDSSGFYEIAGVPFGHYTVKVLKDNIQGQGFTASSMIEIDLTQPVQTIDITLLPPNDIYRRIIVKCWIDTIDDESWSSNEYSNTFYIQEVFVQPWHTHEEVYFEQKMGGEIRIELRFSIDLNFDRSVSVNINAKMYEGSTESTNDLDDEENSTGILVNKDSTTVGEMHLYNDEFDGGDTSHILFDITNLVQP